MTPEAIRLYSACRIALATVCGPWHARQVRLRTEDLEWAVAIAATRAPYLGYHPQRLLPVYDIASPPHRPTAFDLPEPDVYGVPALSVGLRVDRSHMWDPWVIRMVAERLTEMVATQTPYATL